MVVFGFMPVWSLAMALGGGIYCFPVPLHERRSWWPEFVGMDSGVGSLNKPAGGSPAGLLASSVLLRHHGGGEDEEDAGLGRQESWRMSFCSMHFPVVVEVVAMEIVWGRSCNLISRFRAHLHRRLYVPARPVAPMHWLSDGCDRVDSAPVNHLVEGRPRVSFLPAQRWIKGRQNSTTDLPHQPFDASPGCVVISNSRYGISVFSYEMERVEAALGSIQYDAQNLDCYWNQQHCVNLLCQGNIKMIHTYGSSVKGRTRDSIVINIGEVLIAESKSYMHNIYMTLRQIVGSATYTFEQDLTSKFSCTRLCSYDDKHGVDTVPVVRVDPPVVDDNATIEVPQIQQQGHLSLSSVMDIQYLQLSTLLPQMQTPDRLSGEPPAGHQLVWSIEAVEDCSCGTFGSGLSMDGRSPFGSFCSLRCRNHVLLLSFSGLCHFSCLYLALFSGATMYFVR